MESNDLLIWKVLMYLNYYLSNSTYERTEEVNRTMELFRTLFVSFYNDNSLPLKLPNFHHFTCHFLEQLDFYGPTWSSTTQRDESFHQVVKDIIGSSINGFNLSRDVLLKVQKIFFLLLLLFPNS